MEQIISAGLEELGLTGRVPKDAPALRPNTDRCCWRRTR